MVRITTEERVQRALDTMQAAGLTNDQIKEIVAAMSELVAEAAKEVARESN